MNKTLNRVIRARINKLIIEKCDGNQAMFVEETGFSQSTVSSWCCGTRLPSAFAIISICATYECSADWLLGLKGEISKIE